MKRMIAVVAVVAVVAGLSGCASAPTAFDEKFFTITTNSLPRVVVVTNAVPVYQTNYQVVTVTNQVSETQVEVVPVTNRVVVEAWTTNVVTATNWVESYAYKTGTNAQAVVETARTIGNTFGPWGELIGALLGAAFGVYGMLRSSQANKTAGVLAQIIETGKQVLQTTPQGQVIDQQWTAWMIQHQAETGTMLSVIKLLQNVVDEPSAKVAAEELAKLIAERTATAKTTA